MDKLDASLIRILCVGIGLIFFVSFLPAALAQEEEAIDPNLIRTESTTTSTVTTNGNTTTTLKSPPASAITPTINTSNSDLCTFGVAGAVQTQILGISTGTLQTFRINGTLPYSKIGGIILYSYEEIQKVILDNRIDHF